MKKLMSAIRDEEAIKYANELFPPLHPAWSGSENQACQSGFEAGWDARDKLDNEEIKRLENIVMNQYQLITSQGIRDMEQLDELKVLNSVYRMNRDYIDFVKGKLANTGFVTEQDIVDYRNSIARSKK